MHKHWKTLYCPNVFNVLCQKPRTVSKNSKNAIPQRSWGPVSVSRTSLWDYWGIAIFEFFETVSAFGTIRIGFIEFCYRNPINPIHEVRNADTVSKKPKNPIPQRSWGPVSETPGEPRLLGNCAFWNSCSILHFMNWVYCVLSCFLQEKLIVSIRSWE